ncbi:MAG: twin-arginine translocase TatA/TatE family subunit [Acidimicrobiia bacterium]|nr:twin-arginine translocase TatA/TatE family subunit [Acidimicrobiia bacterium]
MFGIQTSELIVIALIAILLFGPERVPEFFHRAGQFMSKVQRSADDLWTSLQTEMNQVTKPLEDMGKDIKSIGDKISNPLDSPGVDPAPEGELDPQAEAESDPHPPTEET